MLQRYIKCFGAILAITTAMMSCGKKDFNVDTAPPDVGGSKDSAQQLIDTMLKFDGSKIVQAAAFPGLVCDNEPRLATVTLTLDMNYKSVGVNLRMSKPPEPLFSTGYYAGPGELITVDIPQGMYQMSAQIGGWTDDVGSYPNPPRDAVVYTKQQLSPGRNYLRNLYGGTIYLNAAVPVVNPVTVTMGNVIKSPDFVLGESKDVEWKTRLQNSCVPWLELRSRFVSFLVPRDRCLTTSFPSMETALKQWDSIIVNDYQGWEGLSQNPADPVDQAPIIAYRIVYENAMAPGVGGHNGNPVVVANTSSWFDGLVNVTNPRADGLWGLLHEIGHNNQQTAYWSWSTLGETTNNLFSFKVANRMYRSGLSNTWLPNHPALATDFPNALAFAAAAGAKNFDGTTDTRINSPFARMTPFIQIFDYIKPNMAGVNKSNKDGWAFMGELYKQARRAPRPNVSDLTMHDFVYRALCNMTQYDWLAFFKAWGISISDLAAEEMGNLYGPIGFKAWEYNPLTRTGGTGVYVSDDYNPANWKIAGFSSEEPEGEGPPNGQAISILDGDINTFWHSQWDIDVAPEPPHWIAVDLKKRLNFSAFKFVQRQNNSDVRPKKVYIDYSNDISNGGVSNEANWTTVSAGGYALSTGVLGYQTIALGTNVSARYVRVRIQSTADINNGDIYAAIAEFAITQ
ncbi:M60 family metallopeptidase [Niabella pedocola]|uniref:M60 family metallopeptidase n=1 Tax=Niabella pedocola TaxID=1752077 RepID=A0ABS8PUC3_9BACT|nr:M60 family metallopeptidase [Niabella pedocola]MCD2424664.1 M60 family metallopeptidase [Niabella pedocola]